MNKLKTIILSTFLFFFLFVSSVFGEINLLMIENPTCKYCLAWKQEVLDIYKQSPYADIFKLVILDITQPKPEWLRLRHDVNNTPTFVLWDNVLKEEIVRINGYTPGEPRKFFETLDRIKKNINKSQFYLWI